MPPCVECKVEVQRSEMRGAPDDLRCSTCAAKYSRTYEGPRRTAARAAPPVVTVTLCIAATAASLAYWQYPPAAKWLPGNPSAIWSGELWRLVTTTLVHVNLIHLVFNLYWLCRFGRLIEGWLGPLRFTGLILLLAAGSSATAFLFGEYGVGLSGIGFGLFGMLYALRRHKAFAAEELQPKVVQLWVGWFFLCILTTYLGVLAVGNVAHGAGAVLGWLVGQATLARARGRLLAGLCLLTAALVGTTQYMPWDGQYVFFRGVECLHRGDLDGARYWLEKAERNPSEDPRLRSYRDWLREAPRPKDGE